MALTQREAMYIADIALGFRYGTTTHGAAYAFKDIVGEGQGGNQPVTPPSTFIRWIRDPNSNEFEPRWNNRLWNSCGVTVGLSEAGTVSLVSRAEPTGERYLFNSEYSRGDGYSFRKCNQLPSSSRVLATITYGGNLDAAVPEEPDPVPSGNALVLVETVEELYEKILIETRRLAG